MKECKQCGNQFPTWTKINGRKHSLKNRKYCLVCSPFGQHNTKKIHLIGDDTNTYFCETCNKEYIYRNHASMSRKECQSCNVGRRKKQRRKDLIEYWGGQCVICGYNTYDGALEFHHIDPSKKEFNISIPSMSRSYDEILKESEKCTLICSNCHRELHAGMIVISCVEYASIA